MDGKGRGEGGVQCKGRQTGRWRGRYQQKGGLSQGRVERKEETSGGAGDLGEGVGGRGGRGAGGGLQEVTSDKWKEGQSGADRTTSKVETFDKKMSSPAEARLG